MLILPKVIYSNFFVNQILSFQSITQASNKKMEIADNLFKLANRDFRKNNYIQAISLWKQSLRIYRVENENEKISDIIVRISIAYIRQSKYINAIPYLEEYLEISHYNREDKRHAKVLINLGISYVKIGAYSKALPIYRKAGLLMHQLGDKKGLGQVLINLGTTFEALGSYDQAIVSYQQSLIFSQESQDSEGEVTALSNLGHIYANQGQYLEATQKFNKSLAISQELNQPLQTAGTLINLGSVYFFQGNTNKALRLYQQSLELAQKARDTEHISLALGSIGMVHAENKNFLNAIAYYKRSLAMSESQGDLATQAKTLNNLAHTLYTSGKPAQAESYLRQSLSILDELRQDLTDLNKISLFDTQAKTYNLLQQVLIAQGRSEDALTISEQSRARALTNLLNQRLTFSSDNPNSQIQDSLPSLEQLKQIAQDRQAALIEYTLVPQDDFVHQGKQMGIPGYIYIWVIQPDGTIHHHTTDLTAFNQEHESLAKFIRTTLCFEVADYCQQHMTVSTRGATNLTSQDIQDLRRGIAVVPTNNGTSQTNLKQLHQLLIEPIAQHLPQDPTQPVIIIPDRELFLVPFAALPNPNSTSNQDKYLIHQHTLTTAPSIQTLQYTAKAKEALAKTQTPQQDKALIVGNPTMEPSLQLRPLPGAEREAKAIAELTGNAALIGEQATEDAIMEQLTEARWLHFATHGLLDYGTERGSAKMPGAIVLAPSSEVKAVDKSIQSLTFDNLNPNDGLLTADEISNLRLNAELVVLSACDTGRGDLTGDGVVGLSRSFLAAGVPSVVVSLWSVSDSSTEQLMKAFYNNLNNKGLNKAQALRQAMLQMLEKNPNISPMDWAAFTLVGEAD